MDRGQWKKVSFSNSKKKKAILSRFSRDNVESMIYAKTYKYSFYNFNLPLPPSPILHERRGEKQFLG